MNKTRDRLFVWFWIVVGLSVQIFGGLKKAGPESFYSLLPMAGTVILFAALALYAQNKGWSRNWGLMGIFSVLGVLILVFLPRRAAK